MGFQLQGGSGGGVVSSPGLGVTGSGVITSTQQPAAGGGSPPAPPGTIIYPGKLVPADPLQPTTPQTPGGPDPATPPYVYPALPLPVGGKPSDP
jgi:hypothetical protein